MAPATDPGDLLDVDGVDALYGGDPAEFVARRTALVRRLKAEGEKGVAAEVAKLRRPSVVAAALNRAVRAQPEVVDDLLAASEALADAQRAALLDGDAAELRTAASRRRQVLGELVATATGELGAAQAPQVSGTVEAALADEGLAELLRRGALTDTLDAPASFGFGTELGGAPAAPTTRRRPGRASERAGDEVEAGDDQRAAKEAAEEKARAKAARARRRAAEKELASARTELDRVEAELREAEADLVAAREAEAQARDRVGEATSRCDDLSARIGRIEDELAALSDATR